MSFILSKYTNEEFVIIHIDPIEMMINDKAVQVIEKLFESFFSRYQIGWEESTEGSDFNFIMFFYCISNVIK